MNRIARKGRGILVALGLLFTIYIVLFIQRKEINTVASVVIRKLMNPERDTETYNKTDIEETKNSNDFKKTYNDESIEEFVLSEESDPEILVKTNANISNARRSKYANNSKPGLTGYEELSIRRKKGFFDGIPLRDLLIHTEFLQQPKSVCRHAGHEMVALVQSACPHKDHRKAIRETWGLRAFKLKIPVIFFVGKCPESTEESELFHDIVEVNFEDSYYNNTLKSLARFKWFIENCNKSRSLFMVDDDTAVMIDLLLEYMRDGIGYSMVGSAVPTGHIFRERDSPWFVPEWFYPLPNYPDYLGGWAYVTNGSYVDLLFKASLELTFISVDDAFFTGYVAELIGMHRINDKRFDFNGKTIVTCDDSSIIATQNLAPDMLRDFWAKRNKECKLES